MENQQTGTDKPNQIQAMELRKNTPNTPASGQISLPPHIRIINADDLEMRLLLHKMLFIKTADKNALDEEDFYYSNVVTAILDIAKSLNFMPSHLKQASERFLRTKQFGNRIEIADFFEGEERKPLLSEFDKQQISKRYRLQLESQNNGN